jgi:hypothetical protein
MACPNSKNGPKNGFRPLGISHLNLKLLIGFWTFSIVVALSHLLLKDENAQPLIWFHSFLKKLCIEFCTFFLWKWKCLCRKNIHNLRHENWESKWRVYELKTCAATWISSSFHNISGKMKMIIKNSNRLFVTILYWIETLKTLKIRHYVSYLVLECTKLIP